MEKWVKEAKEIAESEAKDFIESMNSIAEEKDLEPEWFLEEVIKNIHRLKGKEYET